MLSLLYLIYSVTVHRCEGVYEEAGILLLPTGVVPLFANTFQWVKQCPTLRTR